ncbi:hypothetical protein CBM2587_A20136 [Cupriavidus taiwanensis]|uniref:RlmI-like PUA domain-containing protein n=1 Tax=Cupriavidus taiwanensis TaxID=164546 RepID=A0A975WZU9_9BURK|nr:hypothetical protein CBM2587_A20136 [Cupriavidus taiwanensis]
MQSATGTARFFPHTNMNTITLKPGKEKSLLRRHPWIYATALPPPKAAASRAPP